MIYPLTNQNTSIDILTYPMIDQITSKDTIKYPMTDQNTFIDTTTYPISDQITSKNTLNFPSQRVLWLEMLAWAQGALDWNHSLGPNLPGTQFHVLKITS